MDGWSTPDAEVPYVTTEQMVEIDRAMIDDFHIELTQMMENAGRALARLARRRFLALDPRGRHVVVLAGTGGNGGGALVGARHLHNAGANVTAVVTRPDDEFSSVPRHQLDIARHIGLEVLAAERIEEVRLADLVVDGVIGYSLRGAPQGPAAGLIRWANSQPAPVLALDAPSGVDTTTGTVYDPAVRATATMTLALPKQGLRAEGVNRQVGELYLADISVPPRLYDRLGLAVGPLLATDDILRLA